MRISVLVVSLCVAGIPGLLNAQRLAVGSFAASDLQGWEPHVFSKATDYQLTQQVGGDIVLAAQCSDSASALVHKQRIDLNKTPYLSWSWRVAEVFPDLDENQKSGDDYAARVYVAIDGGWAPWKSRVINYVWSSSHAKGSDWKNPYAPDQVRMLAVQSGMPDAKGMVHEVRNVRDDFERLFGIQADYIDAVAIMTDCDNSDTQALAWYGDIFFEPTRQAQANP
jgi:hypothetical protein